MKARNIDRVKALMSQIQTIDREHKQLRTLWNDREETCSKSPIPLASQIWLSIGQWSPSSTNSNTRTVQVHMTDRQVEDILRNFILAREYALLELKDLGVTDVEGIDA